MIIAIIRLRHQIPPVQLLSALQAGGVTHAEITLNTPGALNTIEQWAAQHQNIGAGTVRTLEQAKNAISAGAKFLVIPITDFEVLNLAADKGIPVYCGATTPTEIENAYRHPAVKAVKVFPVAALGGPAYIKAIQDPLPDIPLLPTGGIILETVPQYVDLECAGVGIGSALVSEELVSRNCWDEITSRASSFTAAWGKQN